MVIQTHTLLFAPKLSFKSTFSAHVAPRSFFQGTRIVPRSTQTVDGSGGTPELFPMTQHSLYIFFLPLHTPLEPPSAPVVLTARPGPLNSSSFKPHFSPPMTEPLHSWAGPAFSLRVGRGMQERRPCTSGWRQRETEACSWPEPRPGSNAPVSSFSKRV